MKNKLIIIALLFVWCGVFAQMNPSAGTQVFISVSVTGFVAHPGTYPLTPMNRVSEALELAQNQIKTAVTEEIKTPQQLLQAQQDSLFANYQALRSVKLLRGREVINCDLLKFLREGDLSQNPLLKDADVIQVAPMHSSVSVLGEVYLPGEYEYLPGDKLSTLLALAQGVTLSADQKGINIYRYKANGTDFEVLRADLSAQDAGNIALQPGDRIIITKSTEQRRAWKVTLEGSVKAPGEYLIGANTTLYDILVQCGGPGSRGDLRNAVFANGTYRLEPDPEFERLKEFSLTQMTSLEYQYMRNKLRQFPGRYAIDVSQTWESSGGEANPILRDGDYLFVPELLDMVVVSGQVARPGLVPWVEGKASEYYVEAAGGYSNNRRWHGTRIISQASGNWVKPSKKVPLNPGDTVFVAEKSERDLWTDVKDVLLVGTQLVTIFLGIRAITTN